MKSIQNTSPLLHRASSVDTVPLIYTLWLLQSPLWPVRQVLLSPHFGDQEAATPNGELLARSHDVLAPIAALTNGYTRSGLKQLGPNTLTVPGTSLVVQWLRIHLPMQGTWILPLVRELRSHMPSGNQAHVPQLEKAERRNEEHVCCEKDPAWPKINK